MSEEIRNPFEIAQLQFENAADYLGMHPDLRTMLKTPERSLEVRVPVRMDDGSYKTFTGWRVQHSTARGPAKGGIRFHPQSEYRHHEGPGQLDDLENRPGRYTLWRQQRWSAG